MSPLEPVIDASVSRITSASADGYHLRIGRLPEGMEPGPEWLGVDEVLGSEGLKAAMLARVADLLARYCDATVHLVRTVH